MIPTHYKLLIEHDQDCESPLDYEKHLNQNYTVEEICESVVKQYDDYLQGNCFWFSIETITLDEYENELQAHEEISSCGGFIGTDVTENGMVDYWDIPDSVTQDFINQCGNWLDVNSLYYSPIPAKELAEMTKDLPFDDESERVA